MVTKFRCDFLSSRPFKMAGTNELAKRKGGCVELFVAAGNRACEPGALLLKRNPGNVALVASSHVYPRLNSPRLRSFRQH
jgi:hypothetical protein